MIELAILGMAGVATLGSGYKAYTINQKGKAINKVMVAAPESMHSLVGYMKNFMDANSDKMKEIDPNNSNVGRFAADIKVGGRTFDGYQATYKNFEKNDIIKEFASWFPKNFNMSEQLGIVKSLTTMLSAVKHLGLKSEFLKEFSTFNKIDELTSSTSGILQKFSSVTEYLLKDNQAVDSNQSYGQGTINQHVSDQNFWSKATIGSVLTTVGLGGAVYSGYDDEYFFGSHKRFDENEDSKSNEDTDVTSEDTAALNTVVEPTADPSTDL